MCVCVCVSCRELSDSELRNALPNSVSVRRPEGTFTINIIFKFFNSFLLYYHVHVIQILYNKVSNLTLNIRHSVFNQEDNIQS